MQLIDPVLTGIIAWFIGIESVPSIATWIGGIIISGGVSALVIGEDKRKKMSELVAPAQGKNKDVIDEIEYALADCDDNEAHADNNELYIKDGPNELLDRNSDYSVDTHSILNPISTHYIPRTGSNDQLFMVSMQEKQSMTGDSSEYSANINAASDYKFHVNSFEKETREETSSY